MLSAFDLGGRNVIFEKTKNAQMRCGNAGAGLGHIAAMSRRLVRNLYSGLFMKLVERYKLLFMAAPEEIHHSRVIARSE